MEMLDALFYSVQFKERLNSDKMSNRVTAAEGLGNCVGSGVVRDA